MNLKQLATHLGLSQTTVSRALNGFPEVAEDTRRRVREAAERLHYRPNASARRLATGRANSIGIVLPVRRRLIDNPYFMDFLSGFAEHLGEVGVDVTLTATVGESADVYRRLARTRSVDALVVSAPTIEDPHVPVLQELGFPFIVHGRTRAKKPYAFMDIDNEGAFRRATELMLDLGHTRIGLINAETTYNFAADRERGWRAAHSARGVPMRDDLTLCGTLMEEDGHRLARRLLETTDPPTALLCSSTLMALGAARACRELKHEIGRDVSLMAHDDGLPTMRPENFDPPLTTTFSSLRAAGARIATLALDLVNGADPASIHEVWTADIVFRASVARVK